MVKGILGALVIVGMSASASATEYGPYNNPRVSGPHIITGIAVNALLFAGDNDVFNQYCIGKGFNNYTRITSRLLLSYEEYNNGYVHYGPPINVAYAYSGGYLINSLDPIPYPVVEKIWCED